MKIILLILWRKILYEICVLRAALNRTIYWKIWKFSVFGVFSKNINFSTEFQHRVSLKKTTIYKLLFLIALYSPKNDNKQPSEIRNLHRRSNFVVTKVFLGLVPILTTGLKYWLTVKFFQIIFYRLSYENKSQSSQK